MTVDLDVLEARLEQLDMEVPEAIRVDQRPLASSGWAVAVSTHRNLPRDPSLLADMARILWVLAWADALEQGDSPSGDLLEEAPPTPPDNDGPEGEPDVWDAARTAYDALALEWSADPAEVCDATDTYTGDVAYYAVMSALGHAVFWGDRYDEPIPWGHGVIPEVDIWLETPIVDADPE